MTFKEKNKNTHDKKGFISKSLVINHDKLFNDPPVMNDSLVDFVFRLSIINYALRMVHS